MGQTFSAPTVCRSHPLAAKDSASAGDPHEDLRMVDNRLAVLKKRAVAIGRFDCYPRMREWCQGLFGAEGLTGLDTQASTGRANRREQSDDHHGHGRDRQPPAADGAEHLAFARLIDHERHHRADDNAGRELQRSPRENAS